MSYEIEPGLLARADQRVSYVSEQLDMLINAVPMIHGGTTEAIADFAAFLAGIDACQNPDLASQLIAVAAFRLAGRLQCPK